MAGETSLRDALIARGARASDLDALEVFAPYRGQPLLERVYRAGLLPDARVIDALAALGAKDATDDVLAGLPPPAALGAFTRALAERHRALPLRIEKRRLIVALLDPSDISTIEKLSFTCGLVVEPRSCRPRVLFEALARAYDLEVVRPEPRFLAAQRSGSIVSPPGAAPGWGGPGFGNGDFLPPPSTDAGVQAAFQKVAPADQQSSPMAQVIVEAADVEAGLGVDINVESDIDEVIRPSLLGAPRRTTSSFPGVGAPAAVGEDPRLQRGAFQVAAGPTPNRDLRPARSPRLDEAALARLRSLPPMDPIAARDSLPPMVLPLLVPPLRVAALFLVRQQIAIAWDLQCRGADALSTQAFRDVLLPLTAESVLQRAERERRAAIGTPRDPSTMERTLFRFLRLPPPRAYGAMPILIGEDPVALLYFDRDDGDLDDLTLEDTRRVCSSLADALVPLSADGPLVDRWSTRADPAPAPGTPTSPHMSSSSV